ncbi:O-antigen ligase [Blastococcus sp. URHD0036]|uniref:O-antigen ligase family protein n=1 Tax=Blastococcus sp. URHD0036 TaxID=1380356 RepID=UPI0004974E8F|nr:hypothetical protein [Blastococcus sp. URHD0036]
MTRRWTALLVPPLVAAVVAGVLLADVPRVAGLSVLVAVVVLLAVGAVAAALRGPDAVGLALLTVAVGAASWNGAGIGGFQVAHLALAAATLVLVTVAVVRKRSLAVPPWAVVLPAAIVLVFAASEVWPTADSYLERRVQVPIPAVIAATLPTWHAANVLGAVGWLISAAALPLAACLAVRVRPAMAGRLADAWVLGAAVSAAVALTDAVGVTRISAALIPVIDIGGRQAGLSAQPNHLAVAIALVAPVVTWRVVTTSTLARGAAWLGVGAVLAGGLLVSGSRGGLVGAAVGVFVTLCVLPAGRRLIVPAAGLLLGAAAVTVAVAPDSVTGLAESLRLTGAASAAESDSIRAGIADQALVDFGHSPFRGIGLPVIADGHSIYLQLLAAGGVLLALAFALAVVGCALDARALARRQGDLPRVLLVALGVWLLVGLVENQLTDVYLYVPFALLAGLCALPQPAGTAAPHRVLSFSGGPS